MTRRLKFALAAAAVLSGSAASAAETITYTYDARGRLVKVVHTGDVNNNVQKCYQLDKEGNRVLVVVAAPGTCT